MKPAIIARAAGALMLVAGLAACVDVDVKMEVLDSEHGRGSIVMTMDRQFYDMAQAQGNADFCDSEDELTVGDTVVTCASVTEGTFDELNESGSGEPGPQVIAQADGTVRVTLPTGTLVQAASADKPDDETLTMMQSMFEGKFFRITVAGSEVLDSNMEISDDGKSATLAIPFFEMITGEAEVPDEAYAVVKPIN
ncbi:MAG: hypothetical protein KDJ19_10195 [Hyphomicrobiaceae bacterium]|nr:hypothetical protein [Hyphomicrobiaceae bacterium]MCC0024259.1 hypothetical protein [Hyphomicrobiaceae bacterium]